MDIRVPTMFKTLMAYESYLITRLGYAVGDEKWLSRNPIPLHEQDMPTLWAAFLKVFKRVLKLRVKKYGCDSLTISGTTTNCLSVNINSANTDLFILTHNRPRLALAALYQRIRDSTANRSWGYGCTRANSRPKASFYFYNIGVTHYAGRERIVMPEGHYIGRDECYSSLIGKIEGILELINEYCNREREIFKADLAYIAQDAKADATTAPEEYTAISTDLCPDIVAITDAVYVKSKDVPKQPEYLIPSGTISPELSSGTTGQWPEKKAVAAYLKNGEPPELIYATKKARPLMYEGLPFLHID